jgi:parvulin-like peptidyl-prolyl isomerase
MLLNIGFGLTVVAALLLLAIAGGVAWYGSHLSPAASVNGQTITKDDYAKQLAINAFRIDYQSRRIRTLLTAGQMRSADATARQNVLDQRTQQADTIALEQLIDGRVQADLATKQGLTVADADVDARLTDEATTPEMRHAWMIEVKPDIPAGASAASDATKAAAKAKADAALADLKAGKDWTEVAKAVSTDASKDQGGDLGFVDKNALLDAAFSASIIAAAKDTPTDVIEGSDGTYRIGRVTEIAAPVVDATLADQVKAAGISMDDFRAALRRDVTRTKLSEAITAPYLVAGPQRQVAEIKLGADIDPGTGTPTGKESEAGAVKIRHILYAPNGDVQAAASLAPDDAAWKTAEAAANATYQKLLANPDLFPAIAKSDSNDPGSASRGGTYWFTKNDGLLQPFADAIFKDGLQPGQLLAPVKTTAGWHVIQFLHPAPDADWAAKLKTAIDSGTTSFADAARNNSDGSGAANGGDLGWVAKGLQPADVEKAIFAAPIGKASDPVTVAGDGTYLFLVNKEEARTPDASQTATLKSTVFPNWYSTEKAGFDITRDSSITGTATN